MDRRLKWLWGGVAAAVTGLVVWALRTPPIEVETGRAALGVWEDVVEDDARARVRERLIVTMPWAGELQRPVLREGQWVAGGAPLFEVRAAAPVMRDVRAQAELEARAASAQAAWQRSARQTESALVAWQRSLLAAARTIALAEEGFVSQTQVEAAALDLRRDERTWQAARQSEGVALHDLEQARVARTPAAALGPSRGGQAVAAPREVQVLRVLQPHAATLPAGAPVMEVGDTRNPEVVVPLLSQQALGLRADAAVRLSGWAGAAGAQSLAGRVRLIEPAASTRVSALGLEEQRVNVIVDPQVALPPGDGYALRAQIVRERHEGVLRVPVSAVFPKPGSPGRWAVFVVEGQRARMRPVEGPAPDRAGAGGLAWITAGVEPGAELVVFPPASLADGRAVRVVRREPSVSSSESR